MKVKTKSRIGNPIDIGKLTLEQHIQKKAFEWEGMVKETIANNAVDTGDLLNSIYTEINENGFTGISSAKHAKYFEFGTKPHWVPFYGKSGEEILAPWGRRVLGLSKAEMIKIGGITVSTPELAMFRRSLNKL